MTRKVSPEKVVVGQVKNVLDCYQRIGKLLYIRNNTGAMPSAYTNKFGVTKKRFIRFGTTGSPDFLVFLPDGRTWHLECKAKDGKQSDAQLEWQSWCEKNGHVYSIIVDAEQIAEPLSMYFRK